MSIYPQKATNSFPVRAIETRSCETVLKKKNLVSDCSPQQVNHDIRMLYKGFGQY